MERVRVQVIELADRELLRLKRAMVQRFGLTEEQFPLVIPAEPFGAVSTAAATSDRTPEAALVEPISAHPTMAQVL